MAINCIPLGAALLELGTVDLNTLWKQRHLVLKKTLSALGPCRDMRMFFTFKVRYVVDTVPISFN